MAKASKQIDLEKQILRARGIAWESYSEEFESDAEVLKFLLDRLERAENAKAVAYETIRKIDWAL